MPTSQFAFINWRPHSQRSTTEDHQIRSHCMKGKNKRADSRRSRLEARRAELATLHGVAANNVGDPRADRFAECWWLLQCQNWIPVEIRSLPTLVQVDSGIDKLATKAQKSPRGLLNEFTIYLRVTEVTNVLENFIEFNLPSNRPELPPLDETVVQGILLINSAAYDYSQKRSFTELSAPTMAKTLRLLNQKLTTMEAFLDMTTIMTIAYLSAVAPITGDVAALKAHLTGLHKIITLKGGPQSLWPWSKLQTKLESLDIVLALSLGSVPLFLGDSLGYESPSVSGKPNLPITADAKWSCIFQPLNPTLHSVSGELGDLITVVNEHLNAKKKVNVKFYHPRIHAISARLLRLERTLSNSPDALFCMGMLCFIVSLFQVPTTFPTYAYIINRLHKTVRYLENSQQLVPPQILRWVLIVASISIFDAKEHWLHETWAAIVEPKLSWGEVRQQLREVLWIDKIHDSLGKAAFTILNR